MVTASEKHRVPDEFDRIAHGYDRLVRLDPLYVPQLRKSARRLRLEPGARVLDLCCGTGISTEALARIWPEAELTALDASSAMLARASAKPIGVRARFVHGDAMDPGASGVRGPFDAIFMAYGLRNVPDADLCLERLRELLRPGGTVCFHEYSLDGSRRASVVWNAVTLGVIIPSGALLSGHVEIYRYLRRSVLAFDRVPALLDRLQRHGFTEVRALPMGGWQRGILHTFLARRP